MILKMIVGRGFRGVDNYVTGKPSARVLATNMGGQTPKQRSREIAGLRSARPDLGRAVGHLVLSHDPKLPDLTDAQWHQAIDIARVEHDMRDAPFVAVLHNDADHRHVHIFFAHSAGGWLGRLGIAFVQEEHDSSSQDRGRARLAAAATSRAGQADRQPPKC